MSPNLLSDEYYSSKHYLCREPYEFYGEPDSYV